MAKKILGAGVSGICAAINLARKGHAVSVHEIRSDVGLRFHSNLQGLKYIEDPAEFMKSVGIRSKVDFHYFPKVFFCTRSRDIAVATGSHKQMALVERGGENSLEYALYREAERLGVAFEFNSKMKEKDADIVASGSRRCDFSAVGWIYEDSDFPRDSYLILFDDRYSPRGWYSYLMPIGKDRVEFVNCVSQPHVPNLVKLTEKAVKERKILRDFLGGKKRVASFGGSGGCAVPKTAMADGRYYVGEAAGFQDPFMGFGIVHALKSGKLASDAITEGKDYDSLWKRELMPVFRKDYARRFAMSLFGDALPDYFMGKYRDGDSVDVSNAAPERFPFYSKVEESFFLMERVKHRITGNW